LLISKTVLRVRFMTTLDTSKLTPMLRQYYEIKQSVGDAIVFFRMGDFFEIFGDDAELVAPKLDVVLTAREKGDQTKIPFCGVPHHSAKGYWLKLVKLGYKVAICEQLEDASAAKGLVKRGVTRIYTPGSIDELEGLEHDQPNYLMSWMDVPGAASEVLAVVDVSTGEFRLGNIERGQLLSFVRLFRPSELLIRRFSAPAVERTLQTWTRENTLCIDHLPEAPLKDQAAQADVLKEVFGSSQIEKQTCGHVIGGAELVAGVIARLHELQTSTKQFISIDRLEEPDSISLSETVIRDLEIFETARRRSSDGSLARVIDRTLSPMGARVLRYSLVNPLIKKDAITARHAAVEELLKSGEECLEKIRTELKNTPDLARLSTRILAGSASPHELALVRSALAKANSLSPVIESISEKDSALKEISRGLVSSPDVLGMLGDVLVEMPEGLGLGCGVFRKGFDRFLDEKNSLAQQGQEKVLAYENLLKEKTGISSLKIKSHKSFGLLIEVTKTNVAKVPADFIRRQTMTNGERYTTLELKELDDDLSSASEQAVQRELVLFQELLRKLVPHRDGLMMVAKALGHLDMLQSFAWLAVKENYVRPLLSVSPRRLILKSCRHPVIEKFVGRHEFVANDVLINDKKSQMLITGPNMAGKSTVMRQTAIAAILCQSGGFVPAFEAEMPIFDGIFTRVGASDDLSRGQSTFMVEMSEAAEILRKATSKSLVILDEVGRGTSTTDGLAIAASILEDLAERVKCFTMFATHYHELVPMMAQKSNVVTAQTEVLENGDDIVFTHRLIAGASASSFGLEVARLAGVPAHVLELATKFLGRFEHNGKDLSTGPHQQATSTSSDLRAGASKAQGLGLSAQESLSKVQRGLFNLPTHEAADGKDGSKFEGLALNRILTRLETLRIHKTTPLQALNILNELKSMLTPVQQKPLFEDEQSL
jgi:DNA mismatch repair protein MutS